MIQLTLGKKLLELIPDLANLEPGDARKSKSGGFMDLNLDVLRKEKISSEFPEALIIALSHYYKENGDMIADPDMEIRFFPALGAAEPLTYQDKFKYQMVYPEPGFVIPKLKKQLASFLKQWLSNLLNQGHKLEAT